MLCYVVGMSIGKVIFTDLDFGDDVGLLAEMLSVFVLALEVMNEEAQPLRFTINWAKTKIQTTDVMYHLAPQSKLVEAMWRLSIPLHILVLVQKLQRGVPKFEKWVT